MIVEISHCTSIPGNDFNMSTKVLSVEGTFHTYKNVHKCAIPSMLHQDTYVVVLQD